MLVVLWTANQLRDISMNQVFTPQMSKFVEWRCPPSIFTVLWARRGIFITMSFSIQRKFSIKIFEISSINKELIVKQTIQLQNNQFSSSSVLLLSSFYFINLSIVHWCLTEKHCRWGRSRKLYRRTAEKERENLNGAFGARGAVQYVTELVGSRCTN